MADTDVLTDLDRAIAAADAIVAGIQPGQWAEPTPCTELDTRGVLNHLVTGNLLFSALIRGEPVPDRGADHLGDDPLAAFRQAARMMREAFTLPGVMETPYTAPFGTAPGAVLAQVRVMELLVHGWDLARATGQPADLPADVAERTLEGARRLLVKRPDGPGAPFAAEVPVPPDAPVMDRLAGFLGRSL